MHEFKCLNCGSSLEKMRAMEYVCTGYQKTYCNPITAYYNSYLSIENNKIIEYAFTLKHNNNYFRIKSLKYSNITLISSFSQGEPNDGYKIIDRINNYFSISFDYAEKVPKLIDQLLKISIFI